MKYIERKNFGLQENDFWLSPSQMDGVGACVTYGLQLLEGHKPSLLTELHFNLPGTDVIFK